MTEEMHLMNGLLSLPYVYEPNHRLLNGDVIARSGGNIGLNGENLTITFLSMNRSELSKRLLQSIDTVIPNYRGKVLVIDNGSDAEELDRLRIVIARLGLSVKIVELGRNYGTSGGRNRTIPYVETEWIMFLDNDIYFARNPLPRIQSDIELLGCHFISLPLLGPDGETLLSKGGNICVSFDNEHIHVESRSVSPPEKMLEFDGQGFLSTFLFGGACVLKKQSFLNVGGYDEAMLMGLEDMDFSIRLFREGFKIGTTGSAALIRDYPKPIDTRDVDYDRTHFPREMLYHAALHFERKYGYKFWPVGGELYPQDKYRSPETPPEAPLSKDCHSVAAHSSNAPYICHRHCIALIVDSDSWAFANKAHQLAKNLGQRFDFRIIPTVVVDNINQVLMMTADCAIVHFFWREYLNLVTHEFSHNYSRLLGFDPDAFSDKYVRNRIITMSVQDHLFLSDAEIEARVPLFNEIAKGYTVCSQRLMNIYRSIDSYPNPTRLAEGGVDLELFQPINLERFDSLGRRAIVIGWAGNSAWGAHLGEDFKGFHTILKPAVEQLQKEGMNIRLELADRQQGFIAHKDMSAYYAKLDLYVCTSKIEGIPNTVLEAMACGVPVISTDVGVVPEAFEGDPFNMILPCRNVDSLKERIRIIYSGGQEMSRAISEYGLLKIKKWGWNRKAKDFELFFEHFL